MTTSVTEEQARIINAPIDRHMKVSAAAGSGKSLTLRHRAAKLIAAGVAPNQMLIVMFNKSAQQEFSAKITDQLGKGKAPQVRTYHSLGFNMCKSLSDKGLMPDYRLETRPFVARAMAKQAIKDVAPDPLPQGFNPNKPSTVEDFLDFVSLVKTSLEGPAQAFNKFHLDSKYGTFIAAYDRFEYLRCKDKLRYFSDLIYAPVKALEANADARALYKGKLSQIIIDEYQDINAISQRLMYLLAGDVSKVTAVGDDAQTLYGFRGSRPDYLISLFDEDFADPEVFTLTKTFRYGHAISLSSNSLIMNNKDRVDKTCISHSSTPNTAIQWIGQSPDNDTNPVVTAVRDWQASGRKLKDAVVLIRVFAIAPPIELALMSSGIPYKLAGGVSVFDSNEISVMITVLRVAKGFPADMDLDEKKELIKRLLTFPHTGVNAEQLASVVNHAATHPVSIETAITEKMPDLLGFIASRLQKTGHAISAIQEMADKPPAIILARYLQMTECYKRIEDMAARKDDAETQANTLQAFVEFCEHQDKGIDDLLAYIEHMKSGHNASSNSEDTLVITSIHRAKGLEWPHVIMPGLAETVFPYEREGKFTDIESERRLFYVGMTRSQELLTLISPDDPSLRQALSQGSNGTPGGIEGDSKRASRFLYEADLKNSTALGRAIHNQGDYPDLKTKNVGYYNGYLQLAGLPYRIG